MSTQTYTDFRGRPSNNVNPGAINPGWSIRGTPKTVIIDDGNSNPQTLSRIDAGLTYKQQRKSMSQGKALTGFNVQSMYCKDLSSTEMLSVNSASTRIAPILHYTYFLAEQRLRFTALWFLQTLLVSSPSFVSPVDSAMPFCKDYNYLWLWIKSLILSWTSDGK